MYQTCGVGETAMLNQAMKQATAYNSAANAIAQPAPPPQTLASALSRSEALNERLSSTISRLSEIAAKLGALHPTEGASKPGQIPNGVVGRLNDTANGGHERMFDIENLLEGIERALG